ncbi:hypothetical protein WISP_09985 [Willisornis vidua]|uniref:Lysine-specific demethylase 3B PWWP domain-containing protein n=1 Tax=Willisornis vidua TaxID=1566151 RepID=A0ABQ9DXG2_9PASS|nr:hypothetical protein WISP_09985 [Willisornis vidua]
MRIFLSGSVWKMEMGNDWIDQCHMNMETGTLSKAIQVYVEFDDLEWEKREWVKVYEDFATFLVEYQLVWARRKDPSQTQGSKIKQIQWPALTKD